jgi:Asp-tRNA(Asn)/Glu-tRNA(Gln) amidotransferase B subunit
VVGNNEEAQEQVRIGSGHIIRTQVSREHLGRHNPSQTSVRVEETHVEDDAGKVSTLRSSGGAQQDRSGVQHRREQD